MKKVSRIISALAFTILVASHLAFAGFETLLYLTTWQLLLCQITFISLLTRLKYDILFPTALTTALTVTVVFWIAVYPVTYAQFSDQYAKSTILTEGLLDHALPSFLCSVEFIQSPLVIGKYTFLKGPLLFFTVYGFFNLVYTLGFRDVVYDELSEWYEAPFETSRNMALVLIALSLMF